MDAQAGVVQEIAGVERCLTTRREFLTQTTAAGIAALNAGINPYDSKAAHAGVVQTVLGPLDASKLGFTLTHEHVCRSALKVFGDKANAVATAVDKLKEARDACARCLVNRRASWTPTGTASI